MALPPNEREEIEIESFELSPKITLPLGSVTIVDGVTCIPRGPTVLFSNPLNESEPPAVKC